jgi:hypothetical protein
MGLLLSVECVGLKMIQGLDVWKSWNAHNDIPPAARAVPVATVR